MKKKHFVVLGAGISGLALSWYLKQKFCESIDLTIVEKSNRVGGWIQSIQDNGFHFELGPHSCRVQTDSYSALNLAHQLGMQDQIIYPDASAKQRYLLLNQKLTPIPHNLRGLLFSPFARTLLKGLWQDLRSPACKDEDESVYDFVTRRLGRDIAEKFMDPLVSGIYAGDIRQLSIKACFPFLYNLERQHRSLIKGIFSQRKKCSTGNSDNNQNAIKHGMFSFHEGMEALPKELGNRLREHIFLSTVPVALRFQREFVDVVLSDGRILHADHLFSTIPSLAFATLLSSDQAELKQDLKSLIAASVCVVNLGYKAPVLNHKGFGYLIPRMEKEDVLGVIWDSSVFPQQNRVKKETRLTVMMGGATHPEMSTLGKKELAGIALKAVERHLNIAVSPDMVLCSIANNAIPQYSVGHSELVNSIQKKMKNISKNVTLLGTSYNGVSINDCITNARKCLVEVI